MKIVKKIKTRFEGFGHGLLYNTTGYVTLRGKNESHTYQCNTVMGKASRNAFKRTDKTILLLVKKC